jgi:MFS family permease
MMRSVTPVTRPTGGDDGIRPMRTLALVASMHAANHAVGFLLPLVYIAVRGEFGLGAETIAFLAAAGTLSSGLVQLAFGWLTRVAPRRALLGIGGVVMGAAMALQAVAASFAIFAVANVVTRLGGSPQHPVGNGLLAEQFPPHRRGFAISAHIAGGNVGTVTVPIIGAGIIALAGWRTAVVAFGVVCVVVALLLLAFIRESGADRAAARASGSIRDGFRVLGADRNLRWLLVSSILGGGGRGLGIVNLFVLLYLTSVAGVDQQTAAIMYALLILFSVPMPLVAGWVSDRIGRRPPIVVVYLGGAVGFVALVAAGQNVAAIWIAILIIGAFTFAESPQLQALLADMMPQAQRDLSYAVFFTTTFVATSLWTILYGAIIGAVAIFCDAQLLPQHVRYSVFPQRAIV